MGIQLKCAGLRIDIREEHVSGEDSAIRRHFIVRVMRHLRFRSDGKHRNQFAEMGRMRTHVEYRQEVPAHRFGRRHRF